MSAPSLTFEQFYELIHNEDNLHYNLFPVYIDFSADLETPVSAYLKLTNNSAISNETSQYSFLLESIEGGEWQVRYSYIGMNPYRILRQDGVDPLLEIEKELSNYSPYPLHNLPDFTGGGVGYISYDSVHYFEPKVNISSNNPLQLNDSIFMFCRDLLIFDHIQHTIKLIAHILIDRKSEQIKDKAYVESLYNEAIQTIQRSSVRLARPLQQRHIHNHDYNNNANNNNTAHNVDSSACEKKFVSSPLVSNVGQAGYERFVGSLKENILAGDIIQAVPSQRCSKQLHYASAFDIYRQLRVVNPSPYMFYLCLDDFHIVGASPEQLVKVSKDRIVTTHPIAGTRRRGRTVAEDIAMEKELLSSAKERAEHIMLVDLGRNDTGKVCKAGSVKVDSLMHIERYSHVMHIVSHVSGVLSPNHSIYDAFRSVFPAGTVSGAPKIRAMQLINSLEDNKRGVYAGAVGYISFNGVLDTAIAIRTLFVKNSTAYLQAGGGIVHDSKPEEEWRETVNKMKATAVAVDKAELLAYQRFIENKSNSNSTSGKNSANNDSVFLFLMEKLNRTVTHTASPTKSSDSSASDEELLPLLTSLLARAASDAGNSLDELTAQLHAAYSNVNATKADCNNQF
jgi:anthranilate synthase component 1